MDRSEDEKGERKFPFRVRDEGKPGVANRRDVDTKFLIVETEIGMAIAVPSKGKNN